MRLRVSETLGGWGGVVLCLGAFCAAFAAGFIRYLVKKTNQLQTDCDALRHDLNSLREESRVQEERHRKDRERDYRLITTLQNKLVALQVYIATLRGMLAERGIVSPDPPVLDDEDDAEVELSHI